MLLVSLASLAARRHRTRSKTRRSLRNRAQRRTRATRARRIRPRKTDAKVKTRSKPEFIVKIACRMAENPDQGRSLPSPGEKVTEPPFTGKYASGHFRGTFVCVCCDAAHVESELFSSQAKFDSGTGWPSFYQAVQQYGRCRPRGITAKSSRESR